MNESSFLNLINLFTNKYPQMEMQKSESEQRRMSDHIQNSNSNYHILSEKQIAAFSKGGINHFGSMVSSSSFDLDQKNPYTLSDTLNKVGDSGQYQYRLLGFFVVQMFILSGLMLSGPFIMGTPKFICKDGTVCTEETGGCIDKILAIDSTHSIVKEFGLFCEYKYLRTIAESIFFVGSIIGTVFFTFFQMRRKRYLILSWLITFVGLIGSGFSSNIECFLAFWGLAGFGAYACYIMSNTLMKEETASKFYQKASVILFISWGLSQIIFALLYKELLYWRYLILFLMVVPSFCLLWGIYFIKESPRYLISYEGKLEEAVTIFNEIADINHKDELDAEDKTRIRRIHRRETKKRKHYNYFHLFSFRSLRYMTIATLVVNMAFNVSYYSIQYSFNELGLDLFSNALYVGVAEVFSYILAFFLIPRTERRTSVLVGYLLTTFVCFCYFAELTGSIQTVFMFIARMIVAYVHCVIVTYFPEVYPTNIRLVGVGFVNLMGRVGNIYAPWLAEYSGDYLGNPMISIGMVTIVGSFAAYFMRETFNRLTLDEIEEEMEEQPLAV